MHICQNRILKMKWRIITRMQSWGNLGETKKLKPNHTMLEIRKFNQLHASLENIGLYWGTQTPECHHYTYSGQLVSEYVTFCCLKLSLVCEHLTYNTAENYDTGMNSTVWTASKKRPSWIFTFLTWTMNLQKLKPWLMVSQKPLDSIICLQWN